MTIHEQDRQGYNALTAALWKQRTNQDKRYIMKAVKRMNEMVCEKENNKSIM